MGSVPHLLDRGVCKEQRQHLLAKFRGCACKQQFHGFRLFMYNEPTLPKYGPSKIRETRPDYVIVLPWNLKEEIMEQMDYIGEWGGRFVIPIPEVKVYPEPEMSMDLKEEKTVEHF